MLNCQLSFKSESRSVVSYSLRPRGLYSPWNSPSQDTGVGSHFLLQGIFPTQGSNPGLLHCRQILYQLSHQGSPRILDLPKPGIEPGSPALQADSLPTELSGKPQFLLTRRKGLPTFRDWNYFHQPRLLCLLDTRSPAFIPKWQTTEKQEGTTTVGSERNVVRPCFFSIW